MGTRYSTAGLRAFLASRDDSEHNQQLVRVVICLITLAVTFALKIGETFSPTELTYTGVIIAGIIVSAGLFLHLLHSPAPSHGRRAVAMAFDYSAVGAGMIAVEELFAFAYCYLLWVTVGYGIRYGSPYRVIAVVVSMTTFLCVILFTEFWQGNLALALGLWLLLGGIPIYQVGLLHRSSLQNRQIAMASEAKTAFLAKLSHELRTPLSGIVLQAEMLSSGRFTAADRSEAAKTIQNEAMMMLGIVQEVLHVSEIEAGVVSIRTGSVDIASTILQVERLFKPMAEEKSLEFSVAVDLDKRIWLIDELHFRQVIVNVVSNAVKYTERGSVELRVTADEAAKTLCVRVEDTGQGMDPYTLANLFKPFTVSRAPAERGEGSGLGMHITKSLIDAMLGSIVVESRPDQGTTTEISIPAMPAQEQHQGNVPDRQESGDFESMVERHAGMIGSKWVMIIDDVESNLMIVSRLLQEGGHSIIPIQDVSTALESVREMSPDLILVDFHMPHMNAPEFIRAMRALEGGVGRLIPVVVMTADVDPAVSEAALAAGATTVVHKPVQMLDLFAAVERGLSFGPRAPS